jgi:hypothetical protein
MRDGEIPKQEYMERPKGRRDLGRPRKRWEAEVGVHEVKMMRKSL